MLLRILQGKLEVCFYLGFILKLAEALGYHALSLWATKRPLEATRVQLQPSLKSSALARFANTKSADKLVVIFIHFVIVCTAVLAGDESNTGIFA